MDTLPPIGIPKRFVKVLFYYICMCPLSTPCTHPSVYHSPGATFPGLCPIVTMKKVVLILLFQDGPSEWEKLPCSQIPKSGEKPEISREVHIFLVT